MFKKTAIVIALSTISAVLSNQDTKSLKAELFEKQLALSSLSKSIEEKELLLFEMSKSVTDVYDSLDEQQAAEIDNEIKIFISEFNSAYDQGVVQRSLSQDLFLDDNELWLFYHRIKSLLIRIACEKQLLKLLLIQYEDQFQEINTLEKSLGITYEKH